MEFVELKYVEGQGIVDLVGNPVKAEPIGVPVTISGTDRHMDKDLLEIILKRSYIEEGNAYIRGDENPRDLVSEKAFYTPVQFYRLDNNL